MEEKFAKAIKFYYLTSRLKELVRSGPQVWSVKTSVPETDGDHIFGTLMLAIALDSELSPDIDFEKTFMMLAIHELEEIYIGDITPLDKVSDVEKRRQGEIAVKKVLSLLSYSERYYQLTREFNDGVSPEAHFAKACDKLECVLEFKKYADRGLVHLENATPEMLKNDKLKFYYDQGKYTIDDIFYLFSMKPFEDLGFTEKLWFDTIKHIDISELC